MASSTPGGGGRFAVYGVAGALAAAVPLPVVPRRIQRALRAALAHDVCARHGLALTAEAREIFAAPRAGTGNHGKALSFTRDALTWVATRAMRRFAPLGVFYVPLRDGWETLAFGRLLDRYFALHRGATPTAKVLRVDADEASAVRRRIDRALDRALDRGLRDAAGAEVEPPEDHRGLVERTIDGVIIGVARLPEVLGGRLDTALDEVVRGELAPSPEAP